MMRFWRARNRRYQPTPPPVIVEVVDEPTGIRLATRRPRVEDDLSNMVAGGNALMSPEDLQKKSQFMMRNAQQPYWKVDPSYWWRRKKRVI